ncbi:MAG: DUF4340 domain-containing protein [Gammaproteobacteria bacterium]|nr:DUF4340 domain-containing protein [Gammaproteobacteria bacterium]
MKKAIPLLSILLLGQIALCVYLYSPRGQGVTGNPDLIDFDKTQVDTVRIEDGEKHDVTLLHESGHWTVKEADFLADEDAVTNLLSRLDHLKAGWPVATTAEAADHFKVADQSFVRRLTLSHGDKVLAKLYLGSSPGIRKIYARSDGRNDIHSVSFNAFDANAKTDEWIDKHPLKVAEPKITSIDLPKVKLQRKDKGFELIDLKDGEEMNGDETAALAESLADVPITGLAGTDAKTENGDDLNFSLEIAGQGKRDYRFAKIEHGVDYLLTVSDRKRRFVVSATTVDHIKTFSRDKLVSLRGDGRNDASSTQHKGS